MHTHADTYAYTHANSRLALKTTHTRMHTHVDNTHTHARANTRLTLSTNKRKRTHTHTCTSTNTLDDLLVNFLLCTQVRSFPWFENLIKTMRQKQQTHPQLVNVELNQILYGAAGDTAAGVLNYVITVTPSHDAQTTHIRTHPFTQFFFPKQKVAYTKQSWCLSERFIYYLLSLLLLFFNFFIIIYCL